VSRWTGRRYAVQWRGPKDVEDDWFLLGTADEKEAAHDLAQPYRRLAIRIVDMETGAVEVMPGSR